MLLKPLPNDLHSLALKVGPSPWKQLIAVAVGSRRATSSNSSSAAVSVIRDRERPFIKNNKLAQKSLF